MKFDNKILSDFSTARSLEWIETNGLGGYASGTASGAHSRRYHGLLVAALHPPVDRTVLLSKLDETIVSNETTVDGQAVRYELGANQYPGAVHPDGYKYMERFSREMFPVFHYKAGGVTLKKTIVAVNGENTTLILYEILETAAPVTLELLPLASSRDFHSLTHANDNIGKQYLFDRGIFRTLNYQGGTEFFIAVPRSQFTEDQRWYYNYEYAIDQYRGNACCGPIYRKAW
jgi:predicted glycogen debranching enzyme